ncbi:MAG: phosphatidylserine decarboxylase [Candidatus Thermoplasmatota archaeon]|nr:phosphatidylserine decarboxylase [Candidatus Thermoplasmatota archaeon]MBS3817817.1 phosphatidylserine decarboxylase [Candidatus Thermoplasmatota archaeon]
MFADGGKTLILLSLGLLLSLVLFYHFIYSSLIILILGTIQLLSILYFFRDPERDIADKICSPADGKIQSIDTDNNCIEIFMNIWDVHVNRTPCPGLIEEIKHMKGKHSPAFSKNARDNERQLLVLSTDHGKVKIWQIAGMIARRIVPYVEEGEVIEKGERLGMIRFGSKVKVEFAEGVEFSVEEGQKVKAGKTSLGEWNE